MEEISSSGTRPTGVNILSLSASTTYKYRVCATDNVENTATCQTGEATTLDALSEMCPGCVYAYLTNTSCSGTYCYYGSNGSTLTSSQYKTNYKDVIAETGKNWFLGLILDSSNKITRAFACGLKDNFDSRAFCIEGTTNGSKYYVNYNLLQSEKFWDNACRNLSSDAPFHYECLSTGSVDAHFYSNGPVGVGGGWAVNHNSSCSVGLNNFVGCYN